MDLVPAAKRRRVPIAEHAVVAVGDIAAEACLPEASEEENEEQEDMQEEDEEEDHPPSLWPNNLTQRERESMGARQPSTPFWFAS